MGMNFEQALAQARAIGDGALVDVTIVTNQDNGLASYATGELIYHSSRFVGDTGLGGGFLRPERLTTTGGAPLRYLFSDRTIDLAPPPAPGSLGSIPILQPFYIEAGDQLGLSISQQFASKPVAKFTLHSWNNATFTVSLDPIGNLLSGVGGPIGNATDHAVYLIACTQVRRRQIIR